jgi:hypothetical protein
MAHVCFLHEKLGLPKHQFGGNRQFRKYQLAAALLPGFEPCRFPGMVQNSLFLGNKHTFHVPAFERDR